VKNLPSNFALLTHISPPSFFGKYSIIMLNKILKVLVLQTANFEKKKQHLLKIIQLQS
jgi:hypothetical protein